MNKETDTEVTLPRSCSKAEVGLVPGHNLFPTRVFGHLFSLPLALRRVSDPASEVMGSFFNPTKGSLVWLEHS